MTKDERGWIICQLLPGAKYSGCWYDDSIMWKDERPIPSEEDIQEAYELEQEEKNKEKNKKTVAKEHNDALEAGYLHTDGYLYYSSESATNDMCKALTLHDLDSEEPLPVIDMNGIVHPLTIDEFKELGIAIGRHQYGLRLVLWTKLGAE